MPYDYAREIYESRDIIEQQFFEERDRLPDMADLIADDEDDDQDEDPRLYAFMPGD